MPPRYLRQPAPIGDKPAATAEDGPGERARALVLKHGWNATAYQLLNPGMDQWFSARGDALVGYVSYGRTRVVAGAPVCAEDRLADVVAEFTTDARRDGLRVCFFAAGERLERLLTSTGRWSVASLGAQPSWDPRHWREVVARRRSVRAQLNRARNKGVRVSLWDPDIGDDGLRECLTQWLAARPLPALHFLVEPQTLGRLTDRRVVIAARAGELVGFLVASPIPARNGWLIEQIIRGYDAPNGTTELLLDAAMRMLADQGARYVTLGLAPLSRHSRFDTSRMPLWLRLSLRWLRAHGTRFYNFDGLDRFKAKFDPDAWEEIVALADEPRFPVRGLWAIAGAFARGSPITLAARALLRASRQEARWLARALRLRRTHA
jgi:phosphatidylglycerol lysyltransferase